jgi:hypothetical protein
VFGAIVACWIISGIAVTYAFNKYHEQTRRRD